MMDGYSTATDTEKEALVSFLALIYIKNVDRNKCGSFVTGLSSQFSLGNNQHLKDIASATNVIGQQKID